MFLTIESLTLVSYIRDRDTVRTIGLRLMESVLTFEAILDEKGVCHWRPQTEAVPDAAYSAYEEEFVP